MKKYSIIVCLLVLLLLLCSCSKAPKLQNGIDLDGSKNEEKEQSSIMTNDEYKVEYLIESTDKNLISVAVPVMDTDAANTAISDFIDEYFANLGLPEFDTARSETDIDTDTTEYSEYLIDINCRVVESQSSVVSIIFEGLLNCKTAAHPVNLFTALNLNIETNERVYFKDRFSLNRDTYNTFAEYAQNDLKEAASEEFLDVADSFCEKICGYEAFIAGMETEVDFHTYFTKDAVGISYPVSHSMGDYIVVQIPNEAFDNAVT